jgi:hypothetical protein
MLLKCKTSCHFISKQAQGETGEVFKAYAEPPTTTATTPTATTTTATLSVPALSALPNSSSQNSNATQM